MSYRDEGDLPRSERPGYRLGAALAVCAWLVGGVLFGQALLWLGVGPR